MSHPPATTELAPRLPLFRLRSGELGSVPVVVGLVVIWIVFEILNPAFLSAGNLVNLALQCASVGTISIGIVLVALVGQIDLSVGSTSGLAAAIVGIGMTSGGWPLPLAILGALVAGALVGLLYGFLFTRFGVPSFVITLAGLLAISGLQREVLGPDGTVNLPYDSFIVQFAQVWFLPTPIAYGLAVAAAVVIALTGWLSMRKRVAAGLSAPSPLSVIVRPLALLVVLLVVVWYLGTDRGIGASFLFFLALVVAMNYVLTRTRWGRSVYAVGGSVEAARRAGIRVGRVYVGIFVLCSVFAALGGLLAAGRLTSAGLSSGGGDTNLNAIAAAVIGGTSLFGGRGSAFSALLGIVVIQSISSGLTLLSLDSSVRSIITGAVLVLAVVLDALSRRSRAAHGRG
ncbi:sugar ABC transporter permease [Galbitalea soli]|uniref:Xylose transport system permease protein XylH n=1 Tax=Galbitalea soli TaxID=1268042 RepID=A0A7C9PMB6_9MICO|nr:sugar ABC transporter permease [Galbitalea soli]NEM90726.1 sugar ABC transporter permease [Galbitalea soli]NYJ31444.1 ABC-type xylose transport system permease subunit [Galbitalea soli]